MTPSHKTPTQSPELHNQSSTAGANPLSPSPCLWLDMGRSMLKPLGMGLAGMGMIATPIAQAQTTGTSIKLLEPAGLAAVQAPTEIQAPIVVQPVPQVSPPETAQVEPEPIPPVAEKPDPLPPARVAEKTAAKVTAPAIATPEVFTPEPETVAPEETAVAPEPEAVNWGPVSINNQGVQLAPPAALKPYFSGNLKLPKLPSLSSLGMMFPLAIPSPISSLFGWRVHPISGEQRMHTGTDIAAPMGTPVVAALTGKVLLADFLGGYGMTVALEHGQGSQQTLYAHLSELFVRPGQVVQKGMVIGRVGSTGNSTGPHLHFELRQQLPDGSWIAQDAGQQLEFAMGELTQALKVAQQPKAPIKPSIDLPLNAKPQKIAQQAQQMVQPQPVQRPIPLKAQPTRSVR
jgi:murein DD-endopeptidase MepM/ murein hydrolase activator NlpD